MIAAIRQALYTRLTAGSPLSAVPVYDYVPDGQEKSPPYVSIGDCTTDAQDTDTSNGGEVTCSLHVFSAYRGSKQLATIMDSVRILFHHYAMAVTGATCILVTAESGEVQIGPDGVTREGIVRVRVLLDDVTT